MLKRITKGLIVATLLALPAVAEQPNSAQVPKAQNSVQDSQSLKLAKELVSVMSLKGSYEETIQRLTAGLIKRFPNLKPVEGKILNFYKKYIGWDAIKDDVAKIYAKHFNEQELKDLIKFYKSPTGQKTLKELPAIMMEGRALGMQKVSAHMDELKAIIQEAQKSTKK
jgi:hypothetical protein